MFARTMKDRRRPDAGRLLAVALAAGLAAPALPGCGAPQDAAACPAPTVATASSGAALTAAPANLVAGPMLGYATMREATVWLQTDGPATVALEYWEVDAAGLPFVTDPPLRSVTAVASPDHTHVARAPDLEPGSHYDYRVVVDGQAHEPPDDARLRTQPLWRWQANPPVPPDLTIAVGSCSYVNEAAYDRVGTPWGGGYTIFDSIANARPDFMLWLGDNVYFREVDWQSRSGLLYRYTFERRLPELQRLLATTRHYATWDDHDYGPNDSDRSYELQGEALELFSRFWVNPSAGTRATPGVFTRFTWGDVEVFLLDNRYHRAASRAPDGPDKPHFGDAQLAWLIDGLTSSTATFKLVAAGGQFVNDLHRFEHYGQFDDERQRLLAALVARQISGVVFLSGDRHHAELNRLDLPGFYPLYDFTTSPLTAGAGAPSDAEADSPYRVDGTTVSGQRNFGVLRVAGPWGERTLTLAVHDTDGNELWSRTIEQQSLVPRLAP